MHICIHEHTSRHTHTLTHKTQRLPPPHPAAEGAAVGCGGGSPCVLRVCVYEYACDYVDIFVYVYVHVRQRVI